MAEWEGMRYTGNDSKHSIILETLDPAVPHSFSRPAKKIHDGPDVTAFLTSLAYKDIITFIMQLNRAMIPRRLHVDGRETARTWEVGSKFVTYSQPVQQLRELVATLETLIDQAPPDTGPRRFGNVSFRKWHGMVEDQISSLLQKFLPQEVLDFGHHRAAFDPENLKTELSSYLLGSFGSPQRLDYGTGHELSFVAFLGCIWKLGGFAKTDAGVEERGIVLGVFEPYLSLIRRLIKIYNLEPAGSHGVWGLDDNSFLPYLFGSAQFSPAISEQDQTPTEGSIPDAPDASGVAKASIVDRERSRNMYFSAVGFIYDIKKGPFWEHSPMLYDISGIRDGWGKINKGMLKMYNAEVLSKFPVVQHFPFGSLFRWERDTNALEPNITTHASSQPLRNPSEPTRTSNLRGAPDQGTKAPWAAAKAPPSGASGTAAPWAAGRPTAPPAGMVNGVTRAPWANQPSHRSGPSQPSVARRLDESSMPRHKQKLAAQKEIEETDGEQGAP